VTVIDEDSRARTHLANERTFLAWFRTGLALVLFGLAGAQVLRRDVPTDFPLVPVLATGAVLTGLILVIVGAQRYRISRHRIDAGAFVPASMSILVTTGAALVTGVLALLFIWLLQPA